MNDPLYNQLRELSWRRRLTGAEEAQLRAILAAHPQSQADWEREIGLNQLLEQMPNVPVDSNFTSRVLQVVEREVAGQSTAHATWWNWRWSSLGWLPKTAIAAVVLGVGLVGYHQYQATTRAQMARSLPKVSSVVSLSSPEVWENFQAINQLNRTPPQADRELLALLK
jgi:small-conductance mechanosensitive channel